MDGTPDLLPSAFFSPSKAKQQKAQAQDWQHVDTWLSSKYQGRSVPQYERNEDTLKALLALVSANEKADEEREMLWNVQKEALSELQAQKVRHVLHDSVQSTYRLAAV
jgi:HAUS augmin-like complex subunit 1